MSVDDLKTRLTKVEVKLAIIWTAFWGLVTANAAIVGAFLFKPFGG